ncbi:MAG: hypothetical protein ACE5JS_21745 [Nitrospinota bacterium]
MSARIAVLYRGEFVAVLSREEARVEGLGLMVTGLNKVSEVGSWRS